MPLSKELKQKTTEAQEKAAAKQFLERKNVAKELTREEKVAAYKSTLVERLVNIQKMLAQKRLLELHVGNIQDRWRRNQKSKKMRPAIPLKEFRRQTNEAQEKADAAALKVKQLLEKRPLQSADAVLQTFLADQAKRKEEAAVARKMRQALRKQLQQAKIS